MTSIPERGSIQDRIAMEMLWRARKRQISGQVYLARILAAGTQLPEALTKFWTDLYAMEVMQENYMPTVIDAKTKALHELESEIRDRTTEQERTMKKLSDLEVRDDADMRPINEKDIENYKRRLRQRHLK